jgi:hypothetical protein
MQRDAGSCSPKQLHMLQKAFDRAALIAVSVIAAVLVALAMIGNGLEVQDVAETDSSRVTVISKNQLHPGIGELEARAAETDDKGKANSDEGFVFERQGEWI